MITYTREWWNDAWWVWTLKDGKPISFVLCEDQSQPPVR